MKGVILINTGSPASPSIRDVGSYLSEFLMDERVIDIPFIPRFLLVRGVIVPFRKYKSAKSYSTIWTNDGAPLLVNSVKLAQKVEALTGIAVEVAMRYGRETVKNAFTRLNARVSDLSEVVVVPLFPHYAMSSYETVAVHAEAMLQQLSSSITIRVVEPFYNHPQYIDSLAGQFASLNLSSYDRLLFSYHSIPIRQQEKSLKKVMSDQSFGVNYQYQVEQTSKLVAEKVGMIDRYDVSFQSAIGDRWLGPSTGDVLGRLPSMGIKRVLVMSPAFVADNLETLKDINVEARKIFMDAGGDAFTYVPCLNDSSLFAQFVANMVNAV